MKKAVVSAPGKLHLSGEHAVVYGKPALIVATSLRLITTLSSSEGVPFSEFEARDPYVSAIRAVFEESYGKHVEGGMKIRVDSAIPRGAGMGSSAALAVSLIGALGAWYGIPWNPQRINDLAYRAEKTKHGNSSGSDPAVATHGGILWYRKELEFLKTLWLLPFSVPKTFPQFTLINTGRTEGTGDLVGLVSTYANTHQATFRRWLSDVEQETRAITTAIHDEDASVFVAGIVANERLLERVGVVSRAAKTLIRAIERAKGAAKISGAGGVRSGSGVVIAIHEHPEDIRQIAKRYGYHPFSVSLGGEGVRVEQIIV